MRDFNLPLAWQVDFHALAKAEADYTLTLPQAMFERLAQSCDAVLGDAALHVRFFYDLQGLACIEGTIKIKVRLTCERCLNQFEQELSSSFNSTCDISRARSLRLEDKLDLVELNPDGSFDLYDYLEDCLLLELPFAPRHPSEEDCAVKGEDWSFGEVPAEENPFAGLREMWSQSGDGR